MAISKKFVSSISIAFTTLGLLVPVSGGAYASETTNIAGGDWTIESTATEAKVSWEIPDDDSQVTLYRDGAVVRTDDSSGEFVVLDVKPNDELSFEIVVTSPMSNETIANLSAETHLAADQIRTNFEQVTGSGMSLTVPMAGSMGVSAANAVAALPASTSIRYTTFIRNYSIPAPILGACSPIIGTYRFLGDNRGFSVSASSYRTRFDVNINWLTSTTTTSKLVGQTRRQLFDDATGTWSTDATATASNSSMVYKALTVQNSNYASFNIKQDVRNPLCNADVTNGVYFDYDVYIYRSGSYTFSGTHLRAPDHELYIKDSDATSWTTVYQHQVKDFNCLAILLYNVLSCDQTGPYVGTR